QQGISNIAFDHSPAQMQHQQPEVCSDMTEIQPEVHDYRHGRVYLPTAGIEGVSQEEGLRRYVETEFPELTAATTVYSVPRTFTNRTERQASKAEHAVFSRLAALTTGATRDAGLWVLYFHGASYAGHSSRNQRVGKLMIREHDFVIFAKYKGQYYVTLAEVKSTCDANTSCSDVSVVSDARVIKNNKRSAQHQLRDHMEVLCHELGITGTNIQCYVMWPYLGAWTRNPKQAVIRRWKEDGNLHVFEDSFKMQDAFNHWFSSTVLSAPAVTKNEFVFLLNRFITLSCGVFVDEIHRGMLALLTQEQLALLNASSSGPGRWGDKGNGPLVVHGAAGTGKTLLVIRKLQLLYEQGELNEEKRALYICYWPGIRRDFENKLKLLGIDKFVDSARFYISQTGFLLRNQAKYKHIFMDEAEAICLAFEDTIMMRTVATIYQRYHDGNCNITRCSNSTKPYETAEECTRIFDNHSLDGWGQLWFLVDINQASLFIPKHSPGILKIPSTVLNRVMRSTGNIFSVFKHLYSNPIPVIPKPVLAKMNLLNINMGHTIAGPPIYWVNITSETGTNLTLQTLVRVIIDLCATKGLKPNDMCVIPFMANETFSPVNINGEITRHFVENGYKPQAVGDVEEFVTNSALNDFLIAWALRVKGLEFKVVIVVMTDDDFDINDPEDRKKMYIMASRCTCLLVIICPQMIKCSIDLNNVIENYVFGLQF
ncbi:hypothetical protein CBL_07667, partial [Carabus blaptoides fortunei]